MNVTSDPVVVRARGVTKVFDGRGAPSAVLHGVDFELRRGELTLLMGPSGSGKTTLVSILVGILSASSGRVELCGHDITTASQDAVARVRRTSVGFVFQTDNLFPALTARENVETILRLKGSPPDEARRLATASLERLGLGARLDHKPGELSGGQRQRVAIARAIANAPPLVVGDEITAALDGATALGVMEDFRALVGAASAALVVTHDARLERFANRVVRMVDGRVVEAAS